MPPPVPQAALVLPGWQVPLWQHWPDVQHEEAPHAVVPLGHTHEPPWHTRPPEQVAQVPPPVPQAVAVLPGWQVPFWQHWPDVQHEEVPHAVVLGGHTHVPPRHTSEPGHATGVCTHWLATHASFVHGSLSLH